MNEPVPPQNLDAEESVLGSMMLAPSAVEACTEILDGREFYRPSHGKIFQAIVSLYHRSEAVDAITVASELGKLGTLGDIEGGAERVNEIASIVPTASNAKHYATIVKETAARRDLIRVATDMVTSAREGGAVEDILTDADQRLLQLQSHVKHGRERVFTSSQLVAEYRAKLDNPADEDTSGIRTPFTFLTPLIGSRLYVLGGYTGDGKTALALQFLAAACEGGAKVGFHSIEMSRADLTDRLVASFGVPYHDVRTGRVSSVHRPTVNAALETIESWLFEVIDDEQVDPAAVRRDQRAGRYDFLIVDHLHRIRIRDRRHAREELEENVRRITNVAKEFDIPILLLAQLSREDKRNPFPRPTLASLKGSGAIEQEAALVWFIWRLRDEKHQPTTDAEFLIEKNRYGPLGSKNLHFRASQVRFTESSTALG